MAIAMTKAVWSTRGLRPAEKLVMLCLADFADDSGIAWPGISTIADRCNLGVRTVETALGDLVAAGVLEIVRRGGGRGKSTTYRIVVAAGGIPAVAAPFDGDKPRRRRVVSQSKTPQGRTETPQTTTLNPAGPAGDPLMIHQIRQSKTGKSPATTEEARQHIAAMQAEIVRSKSRRKGSQVVRRDGADEAALLEQARAAYGRCGRG